MGNKNKIKKILYPPRKPRIRLTNIRRQSAPRFSPVSPLRPMGTRPYSNAILCQIFKASGEGISEILNSEKRTFSCFYIDDKFNNNFLENEWTD